jgi:hypothetical protein
MGDFWVELDTEELLFLVPDSSMSTATGGAGDLESVGEFGDFVSVRHPDGGGFWDISKERTVRFDGDFGAAVFFYWAGFDEAIEFVTEELVSVADAENRESEVKNRGITLGTVGVEDTLRASRENNPFYSFIVFEKFYVDFVWIFDFCEDVLTSDTAGDEVGVLATKVEDDNAFVFHEFILGEI